MTNSAESHLSFVLSLLFQVQSIQSPVSRGSSLVPTLALRESHEHRIEIERFRMEWRENGVWVDGALLPELSHQVLLPCPSRDPTNGSSPALIFAVTPVTVVLVVTQSDTLLTRRFDHRTAALLVLVPSHPIGLDLIFVLLLLLPPLLLELEALQLPLLRLLQEFLLLLQLLLFQGTLLLLGLERKLRCRRRTPSLRGSRRGGSIDPVA